MTQADAPKYAIPDRVAFDSRGVGWRYFAASEQDGVVTDAMFSMVPASSDNDPMYEPLTWFDRAIEIPDETGIANLIEDMLVGGTRCPLCGASYMHRHTSLEIVCYRNGIKWARNSQAVGAERARAERDTSIGDEPEYIRVGFQRFPNPLYRDSPPKDRVREGDES